MHVEGTQQILYLTIQLAVTPSKVLCNWHLKIQLEVDIRAMDAERMPDANTGVNSLEEANVSVVTL